ncbi:hypothetical protein P4H61_20725 [Paenibacillus peoriae]|nr:hypothetical protein [Paenibacillus peoriae]MEC0183916.1 hypothetical protein [Paenibacillus peoriae]
MVQLSDSTYSEINTLSKQGEDLVKAGDLEAGKHKYVAALRLLPENHREWEAATWLMVIRGYRGCSFSNEELR